MFKKNENVRELIARTIRRIGEKILEGVEVQLTGHNSSYSTMNITYSLIRLKAFDKKTVFLFSVLEKQVELLKNLFEEELARVEKENLGKILIYYCDILSNFFEKELRSLDKEGSSNEYVKIKGNLKEIRDVKSNVLVRLKRNRENKSEDEEFKKAEKTLFSIFSKKGEKRSSDYKV